MIEVDGLHRRYGAYEAVREVSFEVRKGELFALLDTNGAGKTSTMEVVEGLSRPSGGRVRVLELVGLDERRGTLIKQLSWGERRRLDLALAIVGRPEVLFLDEPTTGLDPESRRNTWRLVRSLLVDGATVLLTTHYIEEAEELADRLAIMHKGEMVVAGTVAEVVAAYPARISFVLPEGWDATMIPPLPRALSVHCDPSDRRVRIRTEGLQESLHALHPGHALRPLGRGPAVDAGTATEQRDPRA